MTPLSPHKTALITGASRGLGAALANSLAARGMNLVLVARNANELIGVAQAIEKTYGLGATTIACDLGDPSSLQSLCERLQTSGDGIDVLVNNAGVGTYKPLADWSTEEIRQCSDVNIVAPMLLAKAVLPGMISRRSGYVINIASDLSRRPLANMAPYVASKHALLGFSHSLLREVKMYGVKVTAVLPGIIDTAFNGATEGSKEETWALRPAHLAERIADLLDLPQHVVIDEFTIHPMQQDF